MKKIILILSLLFSCLLQAQQENIGIGFKLKTGILLAHRPDMIHLIQGRANALELSLAKTFDGNRGMEKRLNNPTIRLNYFFGGFGNPEIIGSAHSLIGTCDIPVIKYKQTNLSVRFGAGIGFLTKKFSFDKNPTNNAVGSYYNSAFQFGSFINHRLKQGEITVGIDLTHFSNGAFEIPNLGLNTPFVSAGYTHYLKPLRFVSVAEKEVVDKSLALFTTLILSGKKVFPLGNKRKFIGALSTVAQKRVSGSVAFDFALDLMLNENNFNIADKEVSQFKKLQIGTYVGYVFPMDKFQAFTGAGYYWKDDYNLAGKVYTRLGFRYKLNQKIRFNFSVKTHFGKADYLEYGIAYNWL